MRDGDDIELAELLERFRNAMQEELHVALPGRVVAFDAAAQTVDVEPMVNRSLERSDGSRVQELLPTIRAVPVVFPGAGKWFVRFPLGAGDEVLVVCCERDLARWRQTGERSDPVDVRAHHLAHAVAIPGLRSRPQQLPTPSGAALELGEVGGSTIRIEDDGTIRLGGPAAVATVSAAAKVDAILNAIATAPISAGDGGLSIKNAVITALAALVPPGTTALAGVRAT